MLRRAPKAHQELPIHVPDALESIPYFKPQQKSQKKNRQRRKQNSTQEAACHVSSPPPVRQEDAVQGEKTFSESNVVEHSQKSGLLGDNFAAEEKRSSTGDNLNKKSSRVSVTLSKKGTRTTSSNKPTKNASKNGSPSSKSLCGCLGTEHKILGNCLNCGRIICAKEGYGSCPVCGESFIQDKSTGMFLY